MERFGFLPVEGEKIFSVLHEPARPGAAAGVLMVHPFAEEKLWAGRAATRIARELAAAGLTVLRFDFRGHGDSDRDHREMSLATLEADLLAAAEHLRVAGGVEDMHLFGFRLGGSLALRFAPALKPSSLALVNPVADGAAYLMRILRSNLTTQMSIYGEVKRDRDTLLADMRETGLLNIDGYSVAAGLYDELAALDLAASPPAGFCPGLVLSLVRREGAPADAEARKLFEAAFAGDPRSRLESLVHPQLWAEQKRFMLGDAGLLDSVRDWCSGGWRGEAH